MSYFDLPREIWQYILSNIDVASATKFTMTCKDAYEQYYPLLRETVHKTRQWWIKKNKIKELAWGRITQRATAEIEKYEPKMVYRGFTLSLDWAPHFVSVVPQRKKGLMVTDKLIQEWLHWIRRGFESPRVINPPLASFLGIDVNIKACTEDYILMRIFKKSHSIAGFVKVNEYELKGLVFAEEYYRFTNVIKVGWDPLENDHVPRQIVELDPDGSIRQALWGR